MFESRSDLSEKQIIVSADDYAIAPGVSEGIRQLIERRAISATSVMTICPFWPEEAEKLKPFASTADVGLHLTLTDQTPLTSMSRLAPHGKLPALIQLQKLAFCGQLPQAEILKEFEKQLESFVSHWGTWPSHIDGHQHIHLLPTVMNAVLDLYKKHLADKFCYIRDCYETPLNVLKRGTGGLKAWVIHGLGYPLHRRLQKLQYSCNQGFSGIYRFHGEKQKYAEVFERCLQGVCDRSLILCHPGRVDPALEKVDSMTLPREQELQFFMSNAYSKLLQKHKIQVMRYCDIVAPHRDTP